MSTLEDLGGGGLREKSTEELMEMIRSIRADRRVTKRTTKVAKKSGETRGRKKKDWNLQDLSREQLEALMQKLTGESE